MEKVKEFLESEQKVFLLLGDSGAGKSTFNRELEFELWKSYSTKTGRIPLLINLPAIDKPEHDMIAKQLQRNKFTDSQIREMKRGRKFVLICDGYDESQQTHNLYMRNRFNQQGEWDAQMIISCRIEYIGSGYRDRFQPADYNQIPESSLFQEAVIVPFSIDQIYAYIHQYVSLCQPLWQAEDYKHALELIPSLKDLVRNPFLMTLSLDVLPRMVDPGQHLSTVRVTRIGLYDHFVEQWIERGMKRLGEKDLTPQARAAFERLSDEGFTLNAVEYLKTLAVAIYREQGGQPIVEYSSLIDKKSWKAEFFSQEDNQLLREACPLTRNGNQHRFIHRSLLEYGLARAVFDPQDRTNRAGSEVALSRRRSMDSTMSFEFQNTFKNESDTSEQEPDIESPLVWRSFVNEHSLLQFLEERVQQEPLFKQRLFAYLEHSKKDKKWRTAAANAITILVRAGEQFIETDLKGIQIPGADLSYGVFDSVQLQDADLRKVNLQGTWLRQTDLSKAQMSGAQFGEIPFLIEETYARSCAYSPDGCLFAVGLENGDISVYSTSSWKKTQTWSKHSNTVESVVFSPDGSQLASASQDSTVCLWDVKTGNDDPLLVGHSSWVRCVAYSVHGDQVASASNDTTARVWDVVTGNCLSVLNGHSLWVFSVAYSPKGDQIATSSGDMTVRLWDIDAGSCHRILSGHSSCVRDITYSPQGDRIASASDDTTVRLWDVETGTCRHVLFSHENVVNGVAFSPSGNRIASGCRGGIMKLWDTETGACSVTLTGHVSGVTCIAFTPDGDQIATTSLDATVRLWDVSIDTSRFVSTGHGSAVCCVVCSPHGDLIATGSEDNLIRLWDIDTGAHHRTLKGHSDSVFGIAFSTEGDRIVSGGYDMAVRVWDMETGTCIRTLLGHDSCVNSVAYSPHGCQVASASDDTTVRLWDVTAAEYHVFVGHSGPVFSVVYSSDGNHIATSGVNYTVQIWKVLTRECCCVLNGHTNPVSVVVYSPQGDQLASAGIKSAAYSPQGHILATGSWDRTVRLWDVSTKACRAEIRNFEDTIHGVSWVASSEANYLVIGCGDGSLLKWRIGEDGDLYHVDPQWIATNGKLTMLGACIQDVRGLSQANSQLLQQRGAIGEPERPLRVDLVSISAICRSFRASFAPYLWQDIRFGAIPTSTSKEPRYLPSKKFISIKNSLLSTTNQDTNHVSAASLMAKVSQDLQNATQWIRSIAIHSHDSLLPLAFGASCNRLETIHLRALSIHSQRHTDAHWTFCKKMLRQNRPHLKSLLLFGWENMYHDNFKPARGRPVWNPILKCSQAWNLRSLVMVDCRIRGRHMNAFWTVCQRLERLVLDNVVLHSTRPGVLTNNHAIGLSRNNIPEEDVSQTKSLLSCQTSALFPRIKELEFKRLSVMPLLSLLDDIIRHCPALQSLNWDLGWNKTCIAESFIHLMEAGTWPDLDSIVVRGNSQWLDSTTYTRLLRAVRRSMRQLTFYADAIGEDTFEVFRALHFSTLEKLDLMGCSGSTNAWALQVLTSCPRLRWFRAKGINAQDLLSPGEGSRPWICHGLEELYIFIDMGFKDNGPNRQMTDEELEQCRAVFRRLGSLKELRVLDTLTSQSYAHQQVFIPYNDPNHLRHVLVPLPIRLKAGLDELAGLAQLETFQFWGGRHAIYRKELEWMVEHWKRLKVVVGGWKIPVDAKLQGKFLLSNELVSWMKGRGLTTVGRYYEDDLDWETVSHDFEDCCGESS
ncbi:MAG: WD40-repeat-containing domain protein [Benniella sp.]|nr:MAG: WD40-repeat-containing domain protein [Benniella sp.]